MKAIAINPRSSALKSPRIHWVAAGQVGPQRPAASAHCGLAPRNGWREVPRRDVDCPGCLAAMARRLASLPRAE